MYSAQLTVILGSGFFSRKTTLLITCPYFFPKRPMELHILLLAFVGIIGQSLICVHADNVSNELPEIVFGTYVNDASREKNFTDIAAVFPLPDGISWKSDSRMWFGKQNNEYVAKYIVDLVYTFAFPFKLNEPRNTTFQGVPVQYVFKVSDQDQATNTTTLVSEFLTARGNFTVTSVFDEESISKSYKTEGNGAFRYYRRVLPYLVDGTYQLVPELSLHEEAVEDFSNHVDDIAKIQISRDGNGTHYNRVTLYSGNSTVYPFHLNGSSQTATADGLSIKYKYEYRRGPVLALHQSTNIVGTDKNITSVATFNHTGVWVVYTSELPDLAKTVTVEIAETPAHTFVQKFTTEGATSSVDFPFVLGQKAIQSLRERTVEYKYLFLDDGQPVLRTVWQEKDGGPLTFEVVGIYTKDGYKAFYIHGDKIVSRNYTRIDIGTEGD